MILVGDCLERMRAMDANSVDSIVTDPPYGLEFMGKDWDTFKPGYKQPGFGKPDGSKFRRERGTPSYTADGNPSCRNCGGDKYRNGERRCQCDAPDFGNPAAQQARAFATFSEAWAREALRVAKPGAYLVAFGGTRMFHRLTCGLEDAGWEIRDTLMWVYGSGFPKSKNLDGEWEGWGTALKPAWEPIVLARKPLTGTVQANVERFGTGALNIDGCRIAVDDDAYARNCSGDQGHDDNRGRAMDFGMTAGSASTLGRWPANLVHDGSDEVVAHFPQSDGQAGAVSGNEPSSPFKHAYGDMARSSASAPRGDTGSAARFFYCAKASRADRNAGCEGMTEKPLLWSSGEQNPGSFQAEGTHRAAQNHHPTVKPTDLMRWLCRLVTPPGGLVLDPFAGSGSTGRGAILEGFRFVGCELSPEYAAIAEARIADAVLERESELEDLRMRAAQDDLFGMPTDTAA